MEDSSIDDDNNQQPGRSGGNARDAGNGSTGGSLG